MKKFVFVFGLILVVIVGALCIPSRDIAYDYLRLHIRANSNSEIDQDVKYEIKDEMVEFLTPHLCNVQSKEKAIEVVENYSNVMISICINLLKEKGFNYSVNIKIANEYFPTRTYANTTLESGYYDAVIVELGQAEGDNWWCVMYPPLCFVNKNENVKQIKYKSIICEWWNKIFN
ncbi:MAG: stage II sporulation protein R [Clostridia bacterium]|nr:stage II sporulation protein R [Clostridia bacterium]